MLRDPQWALKCGCRFDEQGREGERLNAIEIEEAISALAERPF
jgi:hypothetical protein